MPNRVSKLKVTIYLTILLVCFETSLISQTLTSANCAPVPGDSFAFQFGTTSLEPGPSGEGQLWDFSNIITDGVDHIYKYNAPSGLPTATYSSIYTANLILGSDYYRSDTTGLFELGDGNRYRITSLDPPEIPILKFPFHIKDTYEQGCHFLTFADALMTGGEWEIGTQLKADATGTLVTPCGIYTNTIRIYRSTYYWYRAIYGSGLRPYLNSESWEWYSPGMHWHILSVTSSTNPTYYNPNNPPVINRSLAVYNDPTKFPMGNGNIGFDFQNPAHETLVLRYQGHGLYEHNVQIIDLAGRIILNELKQEGISTIDIAGISEGVYILQVSTALGTVIGRKKLVIKR
ncbi:MAG: T9SS type A sorting domain-containing protein [bacterium]|nr:T9SS type A sorting domain-containing protein [bacterium]